MKKHLFKYFKSLRYYSIGKQLLNDKHFKKGQELSAIEYLKRPSRTLIINTLINFLNRDITYLEIGVRNPADNFNTIKASKKYSVDPGIEFKQNPVDFKLTSDEFFEKLRADELLGNRIKFDVIFIDGLHLAEQVNKDISNAFDFLKEDGFIVLHDCNPATEWHARETFDFYFTPASGYWNGTTWKAFLKWRFDDNVYSCCVDSDNGLGILSKRWPLGKSIEFENEFFEFSELDKNRKQLLNLKSFDEFKKTLNMNEFG